MFCPFCQNDVTMSNYCAICGQQISWKCPVCSDLHTKETKFCLKYGTDISSYTKTTEKILQLIDEFEKSEKQVKKQKYEAFGCLSVTTIFVIAIVTGLITAIIYSIWNFLCKPLLIVSVVVGSATALFGLAWLTDIEKDKDKFDRIEYLKDRGITSQYWLDILIFSENTKEVFQQKVVQGYFFKH